MESLRANNVYVLLEGLLRLFLGVLPVNFELICLAIEVALPFCAQLELYVTLEDFYHFLQELMLT